MMFWRRGVCQAVFCTTLVDPDAPTIAEIAAGVPLKDCVSAISGWETSGNDIPAPTLGSRTTAQIPGEKTFGSPTMTLYEDDGTSGGNSAALAAAYTALADDEAGYMILAPGSLAATKKCEVWPVKVSSNNRDWTIDNNTAAQYNAAFSVTDVPNKNAVIASS